MNTGNQANALPKQSHNNEGTHEQMDEIATSTNRKRIRDFAERWKSVLEIIFTAALVTFTIVLYRANSDYANTAKQAQRPWVGLTSTDPKSFNLVADQPLDLGFDYINFGASPALHVGCSYQLSIGEAPPDRESQWTDHTAPADAECKSKADSEFGIPLFPARQNEWMINRMNYSDRPSFSDPDVKAVLAGKKGLYMTGCISYRDGAANTYHTYICMFYQVNPGAMQNQFAYCPIGNRLE